MSDGIGTWIVLFIIALLLMGIGQLLVETNECLEEIAAKQCECKPQEKSP